jgi:outer membrane protein OmpA-like peptidoglycan-associated protein
MTRSPYAAALFAGVLTLLSGIGAAAAQQYNEEDALPADAHGEVLALTGTVLPLKPVVLELHGIGAAMGGRVQNLEGALKDLGATVRGREIKINLAADVLFDFDKADLRPEAGPSLERVLAVLKSYPKAQVLIEGHTDGKGNDQYNQKLSERRADSVRRWLAEHGTGTAMTVHGWGKSRPIAPNTKPGGADDPEGRQKNRRVEITVKT